MAWVVICAVAAISLVIGVAVAAEERHPGAPFLCALFVVIASSEATYLLASYSSLQGLLVGCESLSSGVPARFQCKTSAILTVEGGKVTEMQVIEPASSLTSQK